MAGHQFKVGHVVILHSTRHGVWAEPFEIVRLAPHGNGDPQYHIKSTRDVHKRVVFESELRKE
jgi:hypothetical protein